MFEWTGEVFKNEREMIQNENHNQRKEMANKIRYNNLVGKTINVFMNGTFVRGEFGFYQNNFPNQKNTGYYIGDTQIPLLQIKEVEEGHIKLKN